MKIRPELSLDGRRVSIQSLMLGAIQPHQQTEVAGAVLKNLVEPTVSGSCGAAYQRNQTQ